MSVTVTLGKVSEAGIHPAAPFPTEQVGIAASVTLMGRLFRFPNPVNEISVRLVATGVVAQAVLFLVFRSGWLLLPLTYGFLARVATGPTLSPLGQFVTRIATPALERRTGSSGRPVPGPPKRFAQGMGLLFTATASVAWLADAPVVAFFAIACLLLAATLEAVLGLCLGCHVFAQLMRRGVIPASVCAECGDVTDRWTTPATS